MREREIDKTEIQKVRVNTDRYSIQLAERQIMTSLMTDQKAERDH